MATPRPLLLSLRAAPLLLAACAATPDQGPALYFETESYRCGAEPNLGCGLRLAPALDALDALASVERSAASWNGRHVRVLLAPGADADAVAAEAAEVLEGDERRLTSPPTDAWWTAGKTVELSRREAEVIATRMSRLAALEADLDRESRDRVAEILHDELRRAFERAHAQGGGLDRLRADLPRARAAFEARLDFLTPEQRASIAAFLDRELDGLV